MYAGNEIFEVSTSGFSTRLTDIFLLQVYSKAKAWNWKNIYPSIFLVVENSDPKIIPSENWPDFHLSFQAWNQALRKPSNRIPIPSKTPNEIARIIKIVNPIPAHIFCSAFVPGLPGWHFFLYWRRSWVFAAFRFFHFVWMVLWVCRTPLPRAKPMAIKKQKSRATTRGSPLFRIAIICAYTWSMVSSHKANRRLGIRFF